MYLRIIAAAASVFMFAACSSDGVVKITRPDSSEIPWMIPLDIKAATIAIGDVQQLTATPRNAAGQPVAGTPVYRSLDTSKVTVDATGKVTGIDVTVIGVAVVASLTVDGLTITDTATVAVTATRGTFGSLKIMNPPTTVNVSGYQFLSYDARDNANVGIYNIPVTYKAFNTKAQNIANNGYLTGVATGAGKIELKATVYGVTRADTINMATVYPPTAGFLMYGTPLAFDRSGVVIAVGGTVTWTNYGASGDSAAVSFPNGGATDIPVVTPGVPVSRSFPVVGEFRFINPYTGASGTVYVRENQ